MTEDNYTKKSFYKIIIAQPIGVLSLAIGVIVFLGWIFNISILKSILPVWVSMKANTALGFIFAGISLTALLISDERTFGLKEKIYSKIGLFSAIITGIIGILTFSEYIFRFDLGIDQLLFNDSIKAVATLNPGRMAPDTALCFILISIALFILKSMHKNHRFIYGSLLCGILILSLSLVSITSYFNFSIAPKGWMGLTNMAIHTAILFALLGIEIVRLSIKKRSFEWHLSNMMTMGFIGGLILILFIGFNSSRSLVRMKETDDKTLQIEEVLRNTSHFMNEVVSAQTATRGYILTGLEIFEKQYLSAAANSRSNLEKLKLVSPGNTSKSLLIATLNKNLEEALQWWEESINLRHNGKISPEIEIKMTQHGQEHLDNIKATINKIESEILALEQNFLRDTNIITNITYTVILMGTTVTIVILMMVLLGLNRQIEKRLLAEEKLRESEERLNFALSAPNDAIWDFIPAKESLFWSPRYYTMLGFKPDEFPPTVEMWRSLIHPDDLEEAEKKLTECFVGNTDYYNMECRFKTNDGNHIWIMVRGKVIERDENNEIIRITGTHTDITERKLAEEKLNKKTEELDSYFTNALDLFCIADTDGYFIRLNKEWEACLGYSLQELEGKKFLDFIHPDDLPATIDAVSQLGEQKEILNFTNRYRAKDGSFRIIEWRAISKGKSIYAAARDITNHKKTEEDLRLSQITYRGIIDSVHEAIYIQDEEGRFLDVNLAVEKMYGYEREFLIGKTPEVLSAPGMNDFGPVIKAIQSALNGVPQSFEFWGLAKDGRIFPKDVSVSSGNYFGKKVVIAVARDVTERKKAEELLRNERILIENIMQTSPVGIVTSNEDGLINYANSRAISILGLTKEEITQRTYDNPNWKITDSDGNIFPAEKLPFMIVKNTGKPVYDVQHAIEWPDGNRVLLSINAAPTTDSTGKFTGMIASIDDITDRKKGEEALRQSEQNLKQINAEKDRFFSIIAHDLRSPFIGLLSLTELMANKSQDFTIAEFADISRSLNKSAVNVYKLLNNLLEWSLMQQNVVSFKSENINLSAIISTNVNILVQRAAQKNITIQNEVTDPVYVAVDEKMINTVLRNLISNAVKFTKGGGRITINAKQADIEMIEVSVCDTGIGIPDDNLDGLFKVGENIRSKGTDGELSTGLGLILCKEFVEKHGGKIWVDSQLNVGSTFYFTVPRS